MHDALTLTTCQRLRLVVVLVCCERRGNQPQCVHLEIADGNRLAAARDMSVRVYVCVRVCTCVYMCVCVCVYVCMCVYACMLMGDSCCRYLSTGVAFVITLTRFAFDLHKMHLLSRHTWSALPRYHQLLHKQQQMKI